jgi:ATP-dependent Clp protease ATP-binding subunit ClpA
MGIGVLLQALYHGSGLKDLIPRLQPFLPEPEEHRKLTPDSVPVASELTPILSDIASRTEGTLTPEAWFSELLRSKAGRAFSLKAGFSADELDSTLDELSREVIEAKPTVPDGSPAWRESKERKRVVDALSSFGRMLTVGDPPQKRIVEMEKKLKSLSHGLLKRQHSAMVIGLPGTGKSALVYEFARRLVNDDPNIHERLRDCDVFELSTVFLRSGAGYVGEYEKRVSALLKILTANPKVILFVDEAHSMFQSGMEHRGPFTDANEAFKQSIIKGEISIIGCTTTAEYRHYIEPDKALRERFTLVTVEEPSPEQTREIMAARRPGLEEYYGVEIPEELLGKTIELTEEYLLSRAQPRKSLQILDGACAYCLVEDPPLSRLTEAQLWQALEDTIGHSVVRERAVSPTEIYKELRTKIVGQDEALTGISKAFVTGIKGWMQGAEKPRGVFLFSGPTGVGKTETAVLLSRILGDGKEALLRVDCNTLKGSGHDGGPAQNVLFGPPPGYIGFVRGKGGVLSHIRDHPECVVLFDEIEKADPNVGELLFRIIDDGQCEDKEGNPLDFRRSFIIFTTNAGAVYEEEKSIGFGPEGGSEPKGPRTDHGAMRAHFARMGLGEAFLGRMTHFFDFKGLDEEAAREILEGMLESFAETSKERGFSLEWGEGVLDHLVSEWEPGLGARDIGGILRNRVMSPVIAADTEGQLEGVKAIRLEVLKDSESGAKKVKVGTETHAREGDTFLISLA